MHYRRYGKTELQMPVFSCGGMRYQSAWQEGEEPPAESQANVEACIRKSLELGINHIETARGYGTSEYQLGKILPSLPRDEMIVQTKVVPMHEVDKFVETFETSMDRLKLDYIDLFSFHGINNDDCFEATKKCMDTALQWKKEGRVRHIGFSTHGPCGFLVDVVNSGLFEYLNMHWYYIFQENWPVIEAATIQDMGVFIISPNDKGGMLYQAPEKLKALCAPLDPMVFNGLFCLARPEVHTLSCGVSRPEDFDAHMEVVNKLDQAEALVGPIVTRLEDAQIEALGEDWYRTWHVGLPDWEDTPGNLNIPIMLRLYNLAKAFDMVEFGKMRYNMLGNGGHWFPGKMVEDFDALDLTACLAQSPNAGVIPEILRETHAMLKGEEKKRLQAE